MLLIGVLSLAVLTVPLAGGRLSRLADLRPRRMWVLGLAFGLKFAVILVFSRGSPDLHGALHVVSYLVAGWFVWENRMLPGMWLVAAGGGMNFLAIASNGGVMPASIRAFDNAGLLVQPGRFSNSAPIADPNLGFLGDIFATPASWPLHNVFSMGDVCILLGIAIALHRVCGSKLVLSGAGQFSRMLGNGDFMKVWTSQSISNLGDWIYSLAALATVAGRGGGAHTLALLIVMQVGPAALGGLFGGPLIDRAHRKLLMVATDLLRGIAVLSLLISPDPTIGHMYAVAAVLGLCGAIFQPALQASIPNLVDRDSIVAGNAMMSATNNFAVMAGPVIGGFMVVKLGPRAAFAVNALSFALSALLIMRAKVPQRAGARQLTSVGRALTEGFRYARVTPLVRGALLVLAMLILAAALRTPLEPLFVMDALGLRPEALGLVAGAWGMGMLLGSMGAPAASRRWPHERLLTVGILGVGACVLLASRAQTLTPVLMLWIVSGAANGLGSVAYDSMLQARTPDRFRGRVMACSEAVFQSAFLGGIALSGWLGAGLGVRPTFALSGLFLLLTAALSAILLGQKGRHRVPRPAPAGAPLQLALAGERQARPAL